MQQAYTQQTIFQTDFCTPAERRNESFRIVRASGMMTPQDEEIIAYLTGAGIKSSNQISAALGIRRTSVVRSLNWLCSKECGKVDAMEHEIYDAETNRTVTGYGVRA